METFLSMKCLLMSCNALSSNSNILQTSWPACLANTLVEGMGNSALPARQEKQVLPFIRVKKLQALDFQVYCTVPWHIADSL